MSGNTSSLRPAWSSGGKQGFQPPPTVSSESSRSRSQSVGKNSEATTPSFNKFAALDDDEEMVEAAAHALGSSNTNSRSQGLRSKSSAVKSGGRSLADLAARAPVERSRSTGGDHATPQPPISRITREKLLSMRPSPQSSPPAALVQSGVLLADHAQDPVCWDTFAPEEIWATYVASRRVSSKGGGGLTREASAGGGDAGIEGTIARRTSTRRTSDTSGGGRWQRGVALPPPEKKSSMRDADNPNDLWDDPMANQAATDFSAFGAIPDEPKQHYNDGDAFDFDKMAAASAKLEEELHGANRSDAGSDIENDEGGLTKKLNPNRPLASVGTTIRSGSGDDVNVFEDFDEPGSEPETEPAPIKKLDEDPSASSRLMKMIGVTKETAKEGSAASVEEPKAVDAWGAPQPAPSGGAEKRDSFIPLNPWGGGPLGASSTHSQPTTTSTTEGLDLQARLREAAQVEQQARDAEALRRRRQQEQEQEEAQRRASLQQQQATQQQEQQQAGVQSQVELVLVERISSILENSWGRADLMSILSTLHAEDSRVIPLLNSIDALRALILRNPRRIALRQDPALRAEMAVLLVTNTQWQQQQQEQQARAQQEELQRREQERRLQEQQRVQMELRGSIVAGAPWYYSDPQQNIQGPFRGEEMRQWLEAGYFKGDLPVSQQPSGPFHPLSLIFPDLSRAFMAPDSSEAEARRKQEEERQRQEAERARAEAEARERAEKEQQAKQAAEAADREHQAKQAAEAAERERRAKENASKKANGGGNESSTQLKMMLGLPSDAPTPSSGDVVPSEPSAKESKKSKKNKKEKEAQPSSAPDDSMGAKNAAPAWGGASQPVKRKSMAEIQKEEARAAALVAMQNKGSRSSSSGWANVAASRGGSSAWSGGTVKKTPAAVVTKAGAAPVPVTRSKTMPANAAASRQAARAAQQTASSAASTAAEEFGAKMSPALEKWCKDQMQRLNGTDDLTLVSFCMTLNDPSEIRQYLTAYLGSTPQVNSFATEFINRKGGNATQQEEWETTATSKKSKKKKGGGR